MKHEDEVEVAKGKSHICTHRRNQANLAWNPLLEASPNLCIDEGINQCCDKYCEGY
jgi:hypothetical protein